MTPSLPQRPWNFLKVLAREASGIDVAAFECGC
jgi:hypothetical protein